MLSGAPFGYRYMRKTDQSAAYYQVIENQARIVRMVYELYTVQGRSIGAITRHLNEQQVPTCKGLGRWERSTVWAMLRNPAYKGTACFGKTAIAPRQRITRPIRLRGGVVPRNSASHERPAEDWIAIPVPALISAEAFALAAERLAANKTLAPRRTVTPSVVQGLVSCAKCGYALYRTSTRSSARKIHYYRCLGSDKYRRFAGPVCDNRPVRQDLLDEVVWMEIVRLLEDPQLIQIELDRRLQAAQRADPTKQREDALRRNLLRIRKSIERLLTAYQEGLISLDELRQRMPDLRMREQTDQAELQAIADQSAERTAYLRLAETVTDFLARLRSSAGTLDVSKRQRILRLLVKDILVGDDKIVIRHSIPLPTNPSGGHPPKTNSPGPSPTQSESYLLRSGRNDTPLWSSLGAIHQGSIRKLKRRCQPSPDVKPHPFAGRVFLQRPQQQLMRDVVKQALDVELQNPIVLPASLARHLQGIERRLAGPITVGVWKKDGFQNRFKDCFDDHLRYPIRHRRNAENPFPAILLRNGHRLDGRREVASRRHPVPDPIQVAFQVRFEVFDRLLVHAGRARVGFDRFEGLVHQPLRDGERFCRSHRFPPVAS